MREMVLNWGVRCIRVSVGRSGGYSVFPVEPCGSCLQVEYVRLTLSLFQMCCFGVWLDW